jgi:hypothetical protein
MRLLIIVLTGLLVAAIIFFSLTNPEQRVDVTVWTTTYPAVPLYAIVIVSILVGVLCTGIIGLAEGTRTRLANRRLNRAVQKLETELNYLRTQPSADGRTEPDSPMGVEEGETDRLSPADRGEERDRSLPPAAPVYRAEGEDDDPEDDIYSGGRAV